MMCEVRTGRREGLWWRRRKPHARSMCLTQGLGAKGTRGAHVEHGAHGRDAGGLEVQRMVERRRALPSRKEGMRCMMCEVRTGRREGLGGRRRKPHARSMPDPRLGGPRARAERTWNMPRMSMTFNVLKLSGWLKADAPCRVEGKTCDAGGRGASREAGGPGV